MTSTQEDRNVQNATPEWTNEPDIENQAAVEVKEKNDGPQTANEKNDLASVDNINELYSIFTLWEKRFIAIVVSIVSLFSPFSSNIYFPAMNTLAQSLHVSHEKINLSVTVYMIFQGVAPAFISNIAETSGRRPAYVVCFIIFLGANIGLAVQSSYPALMVLRCVQSSGSSGTVALANAVIADIVTSAERGSFFAWSMLGAILGPSLSPIIGGLLSEYLGWKSIFWFLVIFTAVVLVPFLLFFPETSRPIVGNGSIPPPKWNRSLANVISERRLAKAGKPVDKSATHKSTRLEFPNPIKTLKIAIEPEGALILFFGGIVYAGYYAVAASIPSLFGQTYGYNDIEIGLMYLPISAGMLIAAFTTGKLVDANYRRYAKKHGFPLDKTKQHDLTDYPLERARLDICLPLTYLGALAMIAYGWLVEYGYRIGVAGPVVILVVLGYGVVGSFNTTSILIIDINRDRPAMATAANNLIRCLMGAGATAFIGPMLNAMGRGWGYTFIAFLWFLFSPMLLAVIKWGPGWRKKRALKAAEKKRLTVEKQRKSELAEYALSADRKTSEAAVPDEKKPSEATVNSDVSHEIADHDPEAAVKGPNDAKNTRPGAEGKGDYISPSAS
ncbi:MFS general substrate transporter [Xylona heveae TC161]|uniref:MFS general substrate transporter n=1 Tax=Xylona heveae (strain CBS 132557 / TC161) TaxID=1328760 RepID=A0A165G9G2_XYLHT|nr:MFS general substrate transporter [Xylona heveae TC161]KZF21903.1 MFS general substrate transporter [Xylona heveae TC161]